MTNLPTAPPQSGSLATTGTLDLSPSLARLLREGRAEAALEQIASVPALVEEVRAAYPAIMAQIAPAPAEAVAAVLGRRFAIYPQPDRGEAEEAAFWEDYMEALHDIPAKALEDGMKAWVKLPSSKFLPKPGELRALALEAGAPLYTAASRARRIAKLAPPAPAVVDDISAEAKRALVEDALSRMGAKKPA